MSKDEDDRVNCGGCAHFYREACLEYPGEWKGPLQANTDATFCNGFTKKAVPGHDGYWLFRVLYPPKEIDAKDLELDKPKQES